MTFPTSPALPTDLVLSSVGGAPEASSEGQDSDEVSGAPSDMDICSGCGRWTYSYYSCGSC